MEISDPAYGLGTLDAHTLVLRRRVNGLTMHVLEACYEDDDLSRRRCRRRTRSRRASGCPSLNCASTATSTLETDSRTADLQALHGRSIDVPACFIAGARDRGVHQRPGHLALMSTSACSRLPGIHSVAGAGHWVQQERPEEVAALTLDFLRATGACAVPELRPESARR